MNANDIGPPITIQHAKKYIDRLAVFWQPTGVLGISLHQFINSQSKSIIMILLPLNPVFIYCILESICIQKCMLMENEKRKMKNL